MLVFTIIKRPFDNKIHFDIKLSAFNSMEKWEETFEAKII